MTDTIQKIADGLDGLAAVIRKYGTCAPAALDELANRLRALSARASAGEGGVTDWQREDPFGDMPAPIGNPEAWPPNYADGYNAAVRNMVAAFPSVRARLTAAPQPAQTQGECRICPNDMLHEGPCDYSQPAAAHGWVMVPSRSIHVDTDDEPQVDKHGRYFWRVGWNSCRDAMLAAAPQPQPPINPATIDSKLIVPAHGDGEVTHEMVIAFAKAWETAPGYCAAIRAGLKAALATRPAPTAEDAGVDMDAARPDVPGYGGAPIDFDDPELQQW